MQATKSSSMLAIAWTPEVSSYLGAVCGHLVEVVDRTQSSALADSLKACSLGLVGDAWTAMCDASRLQHVIMQEKTAIRTVLDKETVWTAVKMMLSESDAAESVVKEFVVESQPVPSEGTSWRHHGPVGVARRFVALMEAGQDFDA